MKIRSDDSIHPLIRWFQRLTEEKDNSAGEEALRYFNGAGVEIPDTVAEQCFQLLIEKGGVTEAKTRDDLLSGLLQRCYGTKVYLAKRLQKDTTIVFEEIYEIGDSSANEITTVVLDPAAWATDAFRETCERDVFQLFVAKLFESGHDYNGRALTGVSRLLAVNAEKLQSLIDHEVFEVILASLDNRLGVEIRSRATLATAKYLEVSQEKGQEYLSRFITTRVERHTNADLTIAFSAAAAVFPMVPSIMSALFLTDGFITTLVPLLQKKAKAKVVQQAALDLLNAACIDSTCREAISNHCLDWLHEIVKGDEADRRGQAAVILAKIESVPQANTDRAQASGKKQVIDSDEIDIVHTLKGMLLSEDKSNWFNAVEGLAYSSIQPKIKEELSKDSTFLKGLLQHPDDTVLNATAAFGTLTLVDNMTRYPPTLSEEQKRMTQLKAYANAAKRTTESDPLDDNDHVVQRCNTLLRAGVVPFLISLHRSYNPKQASQALLGLIASILLSLSKIPASRGVIAQQGGIPLLLQVFRQISAVPESYKARQTSAHALARVLISVDPKLAFGSRSPASVTPILLSLLSDDGTDVSHGPRDLLPVFEGLLALTNIVSDPSLGTGADVVQSAFEKIEDLLLDNNTLVQRAATELICNLMTCPEGVEKFADGSKAAARRLHILVALTDVEDVATRRAAGGGLAMVTEFEAAAVAIEDRERGPEILLRLCQDEDSGCVHRGLICIQNIVMASGDTGKKGREAIKALDGITILKDVLRSSNDQTILESGVVILKALMA